MGILRRHRWVLVRLWFVTCVIFLVGLQAPGPVTERSRRPVPSPPSPPAPVDHQLELWVEDHLWRHASHELETAVQSMASVEAARWLSAAEQVDGLARDLAHAGVPVLAEDLSLTEVDLPRAIRVELAPGAEPATLVAELAREELTRHGLQVVPVPPSHTCPASQTEAKGRAHARRMVWVERTNLATVLLIPLLWAGLLLAALNGMRTMFSRDRERIEVSLFLGADPGQLRGAYRRAGGAVVLLAGLMSMIVDVMIKEGTTAGATLGVGAVTLLFAGGLFAIFVAARVAFVGQSERFE